MVNQQFVVFRNWRNREAFPYLLVLQHDLLSELPTRLAIPLMKRRRGATLGVPRLNPVVEIEGADFVLMSHLLGTVALDKLQTRVSDLSARRSEIIAAIDVVLGGV